ncbi:hypothetical protein CAPTEDRAFT_214921 [Capitella teleta]|uniref:Uncharacterized protein n=1 Tax=Capitella teleta TaxID=283909 RepID=R7UT51_CAPTE|nr:hypothetical protein CAPTEDRAFT_214921 [Capitella teleta]|eukprot:ELU07077.1 hypothetical protein CAPTEDRAFT_214921 [Capitella teleta]
MQEREASIEEALRYSAFSCQGSNQRKGQQREEAADRRRVTHKSMLFEWTIDEPGGAPHAHCAQPSRGKHQMEASRIRLSSHNRLKEEDGPASPGKNADANEDRFSMRPTSCPPANQQNQSDKKYPQLGSWKLKDFRMLYKDMYPAFKLQPLLSEIFAYHPTEFQDLCSLTSMVLCIGPSNATVEAGFNYLIVGSRLLLSQSTMKRSASAQGQSRTVLAEREQIITKAVESFLTGKKRKFSCDEDEREEEKMKKETASQT